MFVGYGQHDNQAQVIDSVEHRHEVDVVPPLRRCETWLEGEKICDVVLFDATAIENLGQLSGKAVVVQASLLWVQE